MLVYVLAAVRRQLPPSPRRFFLQSLPATWAMTSAVDTESLCKGSPPSPLRLGHLLLLLFNIFLASSSVNL